MVNREVDSTSPRSPLSYRELWQRSPQTLPNQTPSAPPAGFRYLANFRHGTRLVSPKFSGRGSGVGSLAAEPLP
jgi:hypothetical protein